jgi:hypothetical protein
VAIIIQLLLEADRRGVPAAISGLSANIKKFFDLVGIHNYARYFEQDESALAYLETASR